MQEPIEIAIEKVILNDYKHLRNLISDFTGGLEMHHKILTGLAQGDRRTNSAFKRSGISFQEGIACVDSLCTAGILKLETSFGVDNGPERALFSSPFLRFWFTFISPIFKGIKDGDYAEFFTLWNNRKADFSQLVFEQLSHEFIKHIAFEDTIYTTKRYWDGKQEIDLLAKTKSGKLIAGSCKFTNNKIKKNELTSLQEQCKTSGFKPDLYVLFAKRGFSNELKALKGEALQLYTCRNFKVLLRDVEFSS